MDHVVVWWSADRPVRRWSVSAATRAFARPAIACRVATFASAVPIAFAIHTLGSVAWRSCRDCPALFSALGLSYDDFVRKDSHGRAPWVWMWTQLRVFAWVGHRCTAEYWAIIQRDASRFIVLVQSNAVVQVHKITREGIVTQALADPCAIHPSDPSRLAFSLKSTRWDTKVLQRAPARPAYTA